MSLICGRETFPTKNEIARCEQPIKHNETVVYINIHQRKVISASIKEYHYENRSNMIDVFLYLLHCVKSVRIRSFSGPYFPAFGLNTERYGVSLHIQSECGKIRTRKTPITDTFHAVLDSEILKCH